MHHRLKLGLRISFGSRWHFGSGEGSFLANRLLARDSRGKPFIPGSTLKGVIRESCEKLARTLKFPSPIDPHETDPGRQDAFKPLDEVRSPVDRLFGNKYEEGGLFFRNAFPVGEAYAVFNQSRIQMHRRIGTAKSGHLFASEYGSPVAGEGAPCIEFKTDIDGYHRDLAWLEEDDPPYAYCLLVASIRLVSRIGGDKSTGSGRLTDNITVESMNYNSRNINVEDYLKETAPYYLDPDDYAEVRQT